MKALLGKKLGMTQVFVDGDRMVPVTVVEVGPCVVTQVKTEESDGYSAIQIGFEDIEEKKVNKPLQGHFAKAKVEPKRYLAEVRVDDPEEFKAGEVLKADMFSAGERADVVGISKGKGFQGVIKRHGFSGGPRGHGSHFHRAPGSIGAAATPSRVPKGRRMAGHMGSERVTSMNLEIVRVDPEQNIVLLKGAIPGAKGSLVMVKESSKAR
ncbi:MAG TPA: 50S ribosomal protein L3 [Anaerolineae bacterium]|jgi:large subunit ribosomal protein L3|nr:50S ribosomal protein L3 [Anaerolineae bacterium]